MSLPETITYQEAAIRWKADRAVIRAAIKRGDIIAYRPGKRMAINVESGDAWFLKSARRARG